MLTGYNTHRKEDKAAMLDAIGVSSMEGLFADIPAALRLKNPLNVPAPMPEWSLEKHLRALSEKNATVHSHSSFLGGGMYEHYIPAVIDAVLSRGEFLTSYTPYQPEISQGLLQGLHEYQQALSCITGLPVVNGSCYDGATALADAAWICCLIAGEKDTGGTLLISETIWPHVRKVVDSYMEGREVVHHTVGFDSKTGQTDLKALEAMISEKKPAGFLFQSPNALGVIEDVASIAAICQKHNVVSVCSWHPLMSGIFTPPGALGVDIVTCEGQSLGMPLSAGGPSLGVFATRSSYRKFVPGRLIGKVTDIRGNPAYALVYEDREQHVAREKATSNICSNQALNALRAVMFLTTLGEQGLQKFASLNVNKAHALAEMLAKISGVKLAFSGAFFNEFVITLSKSAKKVLATLQAKKIFAGIDYSGVFGLENAVLIAVTETKTKAELEHFAAQLKEAL